MCRNRQYIYCKIKNRQQRKEVHNDLKEAKNTKMNNMFEKKFDEWKNALKKISEKNEVPVPTMDIYKGVMKVCKMLFSNDKPMRDPMLLLTKAASDWLKVEI